MVILRAVAIVFAFYTILDTSINHGIVGLLLS